MRSLLITRRWLGFTVFAAVVVLACVRLGVWQLHRGESRQAYNTRLAARDRTAPVPADRLVAVDRRLPRDDQWTRVRVRGRYDASRTLLVRNRVQGSRAGFEVLVPLVGADGTALLVDRGWVARSGSATTPVAVPAPPGGEVNVTGRVRPGEEVAGLRGLDSARLPQPSIGRVDPVRLGTLLGLRTYGGYLALTSETPKPAHAPSPLGDPPTQNDGMNYAYFVQWEIFAGIGVVGWFLLLRREARDVEDAAGHERVASAAPSRHSEREEPAWPVG